ncbi:MAG: thioesterase family protein, partial [Spirochaetia bacterium]|nr:thioesterase family protein [Spirochaetia bacterium]
YLEIGRVHYCKDRFGTRELYDVPFLLARIEIDLVKPIEFGSEVEVLTQVSRIGNKSWEFASVIRETGTNVVFARARTVQVSYDHRTKTSFGIPEKIRPILEKDLEAFKLSEQG